MDYKYIEQLLERYWEAETSLEEERILQSFFAQKELPKHLAPYPPIFAALAEESQEQLSADFDARLMKRLNPQPAFDFNRMVKRTFAVAASIAVFFMVGVGVHYIYMSTQQPVAWDYNPSSYQDSYDNPKIALDESVEALRLFQEQLHTIDVVDTIQVMPTK